MFFPLFITGGLGYCCLEYIWRGRTHWTMFILGGLCLYALFCISRRFFYAPLLFQAFISGVFITSAEFVTGVIVNLCFGWDVWNYSSLPMNILGQICLPYSFLWMLLSIPVLSLCRFLVKQI